MRYVVVQVVATKVSLNIVVVRPYIQHMNTLSFAVILQTLIHM